MVPAKLQVGTPGKLLNQLLATKPERFRREQEETEKTEREGTSAGRMRNSLNGEGSTGSASPKNCFCLTFPLCSLRYLLFN